MRSLAPYLAVLALLSGCGQAQDAARSLNLDATDNARLPRLAVTASCLPGPVPGQRAV